MRRGGQCSEPPPLRRGRIRAWPRVRVPLGDEVQVGVELPLVTKGVGAEIAQTLRHAAEEQAEEPAEERSHEAGAAEPAGDDQSGDGEEDTESRDPPALPL